jgi:hypothetical protein
MNINPIPYASVENNVPATVTISIRFSFIHEVILKRNLPILDINTCLEKINLHKGLLGSCFV